MLTSLCTHKLHLYNHSTLLLILAFSELVGSSNPNPTSQPSAYQPLMAERLFLACVSSSRVNQLLTSTLANAPVLGAYLHSGNDLTMYVALLSSASVLGHAPATVLLDEMRSQNPYKLLHSDMDWLKVNMASVQGVSISHGVSTSRQDVSTRSNEADLLLRLYSRMFPLQRAYWDVAQVGVYPKGRSTSL